MEKKTNIGFFYLKNFQTEFRYKHKIGLKKQMTNGKWKNILFIFVEHRIWNDQ